MATQTNDKTTTTQMARLYNAPFQCFINSYLNQKGIYKALDLKMVVGSVGWNGWFEFGGKGWTLMDFIKAKKGFSSWDAHCWLEDAEGNIYDYLSSVDDLYTRFRTGKGLKVLGVVEGVSKADLLAKGIEYVPGDEMTQYAIFKNQMADVIAQSVHIADDQTIVITNGRDVNRTQTVMKMPVEEFAAKFADKHKREGVWIEKTYILHPEPKPKAEVFQCEAQCGRPNLTREMVWYNESEKAAVCKKCLPTLEGGQ